MARSRLVRALPTLFGIVLLTAPVAGQGVPRLDSYNGVAVRILQSNNAGNIHHIIDPTTNQVVGSHPGLSARAQSDRRIRTASITTARTSRSSTVDVFDTRTLQQVTPIPLSERPNKIVVNKKHRKIYAAISRRSPKVVGPGFQQVAGGAAVVDVIDIATHKVIRSIPVHDPVHNTYVTPDDNFVVAGLNEDPEPGRARRSR